MRTTAILLAAIALGAPAKAAQPSLQAAQPSLQAAKSSLMDNYASATQTFMSGMVNNRQWMETYRTHILNGIDGNWIPMSLLQPGSADDIKKICAKNFNKIESISPYSFKMNRHFGKDITLDYEYSAVVGNTFAEHVEPGKLIGALGFDSPQIASARLGVLSSANGQVTIFRPYEDVLVMQYAQRAPIIYGRCP